MRLYSLYSHGNEHALIFFLHSVDFFLYIRKAENGRGREVRQHAETNKQVIHHSNDARKLTSRLYIFILLSLDQYPF